MRKRYKSTYIKHVYDMKIILPYFVLVAKFILHTGSPPGGKH